MSKIRLHGSSSGYTEIAPVAASGNNTLTLPNDGTLISHDGNGAVGVTSITVGTGVTIGDGRITCSTLHGSAANCTLIPAANIVGVCTSGLTKTGGFGSRTISSSTTLSSQSEVDYTGFGTLTRFEIHMNAVSCSAGAELGVRLGTGGSVDTSGYLCQSAYVRSSDNNGEHQSAGFYTHGLASASYSSNGVIRCWRVDATQHKWYLLADIYEYGSDNHWYYMKGYRTLSGELDIIRFTCESGVLDSGNLRLVTYTD